MTNEPTNILGLDGRDASRPEELRRGAYPVGAADAGSAGQRGDAAGRRDLADRAIAVISDIEIAALIDRNTAREGEPCGSTDAVGAAGAARHARSCPNH